jgi:hypothetical protein
MNHPPIYYQTRRIVRGAFWTVFTLVVVAGMTIDIH